MKVTLPAGATIVPLGAMLLRGDRILLTRHPGYPGNGIWVACDGYGRPNTNEATVIRPTVPPAPSGTPTSSGPGSPRGFSVPVLLPCYSSSVL